MGPPASTGRRSVKRHILPFLPSVTRFRLLFSNSIATLPASIKRYNVNVM